MTKFAELSKAAEVPYMGLLTSQGANKNSWFLYPQTKGEVEDKVQQLQFARTSIFRPGMLQRGDLLRGNEKMFGWMIPGWVVYSTQLTFTWGSCLTVCARVVAVVPDHGEGGGEGHSGGLREWGGGTQGVEPRRPEEVRVGWWQTASLGKIRTNPQGL